MFILGLLNCIKFDDFKVILDIAWSYPPSSFSTMDPSDNSTANNWQWDPVGAFFFSFVVLTTIGNMFCSLSPFAVHHSPFDLSHSLLFTLSASFLQPLVCSPA